MTLKIKKLNRQEPFVEPLEIQKFILSDKLFYILSKKTINKKNKEDNLRKNNKEKKTEKNNEKKKREK